MDNFDSPHAHPLAHSPEDTYSSPKTVAQHPSAKMLNVLNPASQLVRTKAPLHHPESCPECRKNAFGTLIGSPVTTALTEIPANEKIETITERFREIMATLGLDLQDDSLAGTPKRVAKMFVNEIFAGLHPDSEPAITLFENQYGYQEMLVERDIEVRSMCEHHFQPIVGVAHVAYIPRTQVVGLSKLNRVVEHYARRPQVQERMTMQIAEFLKYKLETPDVAVVVDAKHFCVSMRGVEDPCSSTLTASYSGAFQDAARKAEFLQYIRTTLK
jgi:GTP cyclohydrolase I